MTGYIYLIAAFVCNSIGTVLVKVYADQGFVFKGSLVGIIGKNIFFLAALGLFGLNLVFYALALSRMPLSVAYPVMTVASFIIVNCFSFFYFRESISALEVVGYCLILVGISLVVGIPR